MNKTISLTIILVFFSFKTFAGPYAWSYATYILRDKENYQNQEEERSTFVTSLSIGWIFDGGLMLGGIYSTEKIKEEQNNSGFLSKTSSERESLGIVGGWVFGKKNGFFMVGSYFLDSTRTDETETNGSLSVPIEFIGSGGEFIVGYRRSFSKLHISFHLAYRIFIYDELKQYGQISELGSNEKESEILPVLGIWTQF